MRKQELQVDVDGGEEVSETRRKRRRRSRHMCSTLPSPRIVALASGVVDSASVSNTSFFKDGRKVSVGDCALFKPEQESAPFVGIIRCLISDKESSLTLGLNWLYRPAEVKLPKGVALEAAPNEVFYSFHRDEIPAASLLHPCKVAFLPKGVELPAGVSSFVCRRVYDITNKCLWWLTDQDYIDERQDEVDQLLNKTRLEMHASVEQHSTRSPKPANGSAAATSPLKHSPDSVQNSSSNFSSQTKGKKRERGDQSSEPIKRERSLRTDDGDSGQLRSEGLVNLEIAKLSEKGGLVDSEAVARLVRLMQPDKSERKIDLRGRSLLAGIIAATDKLDCLNQFVHLRGLPVLDVWLQEIHKGKIGDSGSLRDSDKSVEDFLLVLLRALDKLPVNLNALQMCNIGKSVNHLRSHKNSEIQKKARTLVDTWKKRVEAEMNVDDAKLGSSQSVPWPGRSRHDGFHGGNRHSGGSSEAAIRSSATPHPSYKSSSVKLVQGESNIKPAYQINARSALSPTAANPNSKDGQLRISTNGVSELPQTVAREEKSSSSSQSHTNSQCSSERGKNAFPCGKEDARRSTAGSRSLNKTTGSSSRHRKSPNGPTSSIHREAASNRSSSLARSSPMEKVSHNATDSTFHEGNNHKLIVKIPNRARVPAQSNAGVSVDDSSCRNSRDSSPTPPEKLDQADACLRGNHDPHHANEVDGSSAAVHQRASIDSRRLLNVSKDVSSPARNEMKSRKAHDSSFSPMNALVESCAKFSEADASMSAGDDVGMNLLASVAARETSKSGIVTPVVSPNRNSAAFGNSSGDYCEIKKELHNDYVIKQEGQSTDVADCSNVAGISNVNCGDTNQHLGAVTEGSQQNQEDCMRNNGTLDGLAVTAVLPVSPASTMGKSGGCVDVEVANTMGADVKESHNKSPAASQALHSPEEADGIIKDAPLSDEAEKNARRDTQYTLKDDNKNNVPQGLQSNSTLEQSSVAVASESESMNTDEEPAAVSSGTSQPSAAINEKSEKTDGVSLCDSFGEADKRRLDCENDPPSIPEKQEESGVHSADVAVDARCNKEKLEENEEALVQGFHSSGTEVSCSAVVLPEITVPSSSGGKTEDRVAAKVNAVSSPAGGGPDVDAKLGFDLNEGFNLDEGRNAEPVNLGAGPGTVSSSSSMQFSVSSSSCGLPASITVAAAAKGPFLPPDDLLRNRRELGWKGSAATSAFRPAEPRKVMELPLGLHKATLPDASCKQSRPPLDIDLNVADESSGLECSFKTNPICDIVTKTSVRSYGGLDLDLNKADEAPDIGQQSCSNSQRVEDSIPLIKPAPSTNFSNGETSGRRDFDLNDGPATEEMPVEQMPRSQLLRGNIPLQPTYGPRINSSDSGNLFSWYPPGTSYSVSVTPSALPDRDAFPIIGMGGAPQRIIGGPTSSLSFHPDAYRGSVLSSSPAMPFQSSPFQYPVFPFGTSFPLPTSALAGGPSGYMDPVASGRISAIPSQLVGNAAAVSFQYPHAYVVPRPISDVSNNGVFESSQKWGKQGLDLNSGPGSSDLEGRDETLPAVLRQVSTTSSQPLAEEQARMYSMGGGVLKRKEPEGGWSMDKFDFKQSSWR